MIDSPLTRAATQASLEVVPVLRNTLIGRHLATINPKLKGDGKTSFEITSVSDLSDAFVQWQLPTGGEFSDSILTKLKVLNIPVLYKKFETRMSDILAWENREIGDDQLRSENNLNLITANTAVRKVAEQEELIIFDGWKPTGTDYSIKGFAQVAGNVVTGGSIETAGTMYQYVVDAICALESDAVFGDDGSYNLVITPAIRAALLGKRFTNGDREYSAIEKLLSGGKVYTTSYLPAGVAVILPVDASRQYFEFINPVDFRVEFAEPRFANLSSIEGIAYELFAPNYLRENANNTTDAVAKITGLTA